MQNDYISREAALREIEKLKHLHKNCYPRRNFVVSDIMACIKDAPAADVRPVVRGEWKPITTKMAARGREPEDIITEYRCSICGRTERDMQPFCNCGAMMGGEQNNG